jgi:cellobiose phosphorylase
VAAILDDFAELCQRAGERRIGGDQIPSSEPYRAARGGVLHAVNQCAWDGGYFRGATLDSGEWIGSSENGTGCIFLNCQTWAILADAAPEARLASAWETVKRELLTDYGPLLLTPAYTEPRAEIGYITRYAPGSRENGGVYMHAATWALAAACKRRDAETVGRIWRSISPPLRSADADAYGAEPYVTPGNVDGPLSATPGRAGWTWYTGSAAWLRKVAHDWVLGLRAEWDRLAIDPCPPAALGRVEVVRPWRTRQVRLRFDAQEFDPLDAPALTVNGLPHPRPFISESDAPPGHPIDVEVSWSPERAAPHTPHARRVKV